MRKTIVIPRMSLGAALFGDCGMGAGDEIDPSQLQREAPRVRYTDAGTIRTVQQVLQAKGYEVTIDGAWGTGTDDALYRFNVDRGVDPSRAHGPPDDEMLAALGLTHAGATKIYTFEEGSTISASPPAGAGVGLAIGLAALAAAATFGGK